MGDALYGRIARATFSIPVATAGNFSGVLVDDLVINGADDPVRPGLRIKFSIDRTDQKDPNKSTITVYNLNDDTRGKLQRKGVKLNLEAGYQASGLSRIFLGDVRTVDQVRDGDDWGSLIKLGDGERAFRYAQVEESFAAGTPASAILQRLAGLGGIPLGNVTQKAASLRSRFDNGYTASGRWSLVFDKFVKSLHLSWSIQDGSIQVLAPGESLDVAVPLLSPETGLVDSPEMGTPEKKGQPALLTFKALLFPARPGMRVQIRSKRYNGLVAIKKCKLDGDVRGAEWYTTGAGVIVPNSAVV
jgi:hypothetical protein